MNEENISQKIEKENRLKRYKSLECKSLTPEDLITVPSTTLQTQKDTISDKEQILKTFELYLRDRVKLAIVDEDNYRYYDNTIAKVKDGKIVIQNPFLTYAKKTFPNSVRGVYENEGVEYSFILKKNKDLNDYVECKLPDQIQVLSRRGSSRVSPSDNNNVAVGLLIENKKIELVGNMIDISKIGIGISFQESMLDSETLSFLKESRETPLPLIIDNNSEYFSVLIHVKHTFHNRKEEKVNIGAEFLFHKDADKNEKNELDNFFKLTEKEYAEQKKKNKTEQLILSSKMGISF